MQWHRMTAEQVLQQLGSRPGGLSASEAAARLAQAGPNQLQEGRRRTLVGMFLDQFKDFMILVLVVAGVISGLVGEAADAVAIVVIVALNAVIGFVQEYRAEKAMAALRLMAAPLSTVRRDGEQTLVPSVELVPGDVVVLEAGNIIPADLRLIEAAQLRVDESALTGESQPVDKQVAPVHDAHALLGDRYNMAYKGTVVTYGRGAGVVVATGMGTELGRIASLLQDEVLKTPLQQRLARFGQSLALAVLAICAVVFAVGLLRGESPLLMFLTAVSLAVAAIPEALPAVVTVSLALGARKMVEANALVRRLPAVETLGSVTFICTDKTGTLTLNRMRVEQVYADGSWWTLGEAATREVSAPARRLFMAMALSTDVVKGSDDEIFGDPTEVALYQAALQAGFSKESLLADYPRVAELPFDSARKCMTTIHRHPAGGFISFSKGALESLLPASAGVLTSGGLHHPHVADLKAVGDHMALSGLRVLAFACRELDALPPTLSPSEVEQDLVLLGLAGLLDPPRQEAREAVEVCRQAGIRPVMITGDHPLTARTIAARLGILDEGEVITGQDLDELGEGELKRRVRDIRVYARVAPEQKLAIVRALQDNGEFVAMTGDGVNDAPALRRADIGIAMGVTGTDVAKEASDLILLDDNFASIVRAIREGRKIYDNIRKFIRYTMTSNSAEIGVIFLAPFLGLPLPLLPIHILWINLVTDGLPGLTLAAEPEEKGIMSRPPRHPQESVFAHGVTAYILWVGFLMSAVSLFSQAWAIYHGWEHWQTIVFTVLCLSQMGNVLAVRSERESLFSLGLLSNRPLLVSVLLTLLLQMATIYVPFLQPVFHTAPLSAGELLFCLALSALVLIAVELQKALRRRLS